MVKNLLKPLKPTLWVPENLDNNGNDLTMTIKNILLELDASEKPLGKVLRKGEDFHVLAIAFKKRMVLEEHRIHIPAKLLVIKGEVVFNTDYSATTLSLYDEYEIPADELHWIEAIEDSIILVIKGA